MRKYGFVVEKISLGVEAHDLAARSEARVYGKRALLPHRSRQKQLAQVFAENPDGLKICLLFRFTDYLSAHGRLKQPSESVLYGKIDLLGERLLRVAVSLTELVIDFLAALFAVAVDPDREHSLVTGAQHREKAVRSYMGERLAVVEVVAVFVCLFGRGSAGFAGNNPAGAENLTESLTDGGRFA